MPTFNDFAPLYDFCLIDEGVQSFFVGTNLFVQPLSDTDPARDAWIPPAGKTPFYTAFQAATFTKCNPRVACEINGIMPYANPPPIIVDANNQLRIRAWHATLTFTVITPANYPQHTTLRGLVQSIVATMVPVLNSPDSSGVNSQLQYHEIATCWDAGNSTSIHTEKAFYGSQLKYAITFGIRAAAWPGGFNLPDP
jgi:hypothetical protein